MDLGVQKGQTNGGLFSNWVLTPLWLGLMNTYHLGNQPLMISVYRWGDPPIQGLISCSSLGYWYILYWWVLLWRYGCLAKLVLSPKRSDSPPVMTWERILPIVGKLKGPYGCSYPGPSPCLYAADWCLRLRNGAWVMVRPPPHVLASIVGCPMSPGPLSKQQIIQKGPFKTF